MSVGLSGMVKKLTLKAVLVELGSAYGRREVWIPLSVVDDGLNDFVEGLSADFEVKGWWARKEGLEG